MKKPDEIKKAMVYCVELSCPGEKCPYYHAESCAQDKTYDAIALIQQLEAQVPTWISVEERLPPLGEVLICTRGHYVTVAWFHAYGKFETGGGLMLDKKFVSHWMKMPEPPKEDAHG